MKMCPPALYDHIVLNSDSYTSYEDLRSKIFKYIELRSTSDRSKPKAQQGASPMEIGAFGKGGKMSKGWKGQKGQFGRFGKGPTKGSPTKGGKGKKSKGTSTERKPTNLHKAHQKERANPKVCNVIVVMSMAT